MVAVRRLLVVLALAVAVALLSAAPGAAQTAPTRCTAFAVLKPGNEVPPTNSQATGAALVHINGTRLTFTVAIANPALYAFMFEQPVPDFDPDPTLRVEVLDTTFGLLVTAVRRASAQGALPDGDPVHTSVLVWCLAHGMVSLELTHAARGPQLGGFPDGPEAGERILLDGVRATLLGQRSPA